MNHHDVSFENMNPMSRSRTDFETRTDFSFETRTDEADFSFKVRTHKTSIDTNETDISFKIMMNVYTEFGRKLVRKTRIRLVG